MSLVIVGVSFALFVYICGVFVAWVGHMGNDLFSPPSVLFGMALLWPLTCGQSFRNIVQGITEALDERDAS